MQLPPLTDGIIQRRYQRFLAEVTLADGHSVTAHCPNTGSMATCWAPGAPVQLSYSESPTRKLPWTLERIDMGGGWIGVHTGRPNPVLAEGIAAGLIPSLGGYRQLRPEAPFHAQGLPSGRLDLHLTEGNGPDAWVEIKNVTLLDGGAVRFPDAVSERGRKHLDLLAEAVRLGLRGVLLFAVNRPEGGHFAPAWGIDPRYAQRLCEVVALGVEVMAVRILHGPDCIGAGPLLPLDLTPSQ